MVERQLVELDVAGSNPVSHPYRKVPHERDFLYEVSVTDSLSESRNER